MPNIQAAPLHYYKPFRQYVDAEPGVIVILARHGATEANEAKVPLVRGWEDFSLDDHGKLEAQLLGYRLKKYDPRKIIHSDFLRDTETANIIANIIPTNDIEVDNNLRTWDVGRFSGQSLKQANPAIEQIYKNPWTKPPGSDESFNDFSTRFIGCLERYLSLGSIEAYRPILLVTHGKNIALAKTYVDGGNVWESIMPGAGKMAIISVNNDRTLSIELEKPTENVIEDV